jgi:hypothetical protein
LSTSVWGTRPASSMIRRIPPPTTVSFAHAAGRQHIGASVSTITERAITARPGCDRPHRPVATNVATGPFA